MINTYTCNDCGFPAAFMTEKTLARGSAVREPGEALCSSCTSTRIVIMRSLDKIPNTLTEIRAQRMVRA